MEEYLDGSMSLEDVYALENLERLEGFSELDYRENDSAEIEDVDEEREDEDLESEEDEEWY